MYLHDDDKVLSLSLLTGSQTVRIIVRRIGTGCAVPRLLTRLRLLASYHKTSAKRSINDGKCNKKITLLSLPLSMMVACLPVSQATVMFRSGEGSYKFKFLLATFRVK
jgi:hypothetical protein